jgi:hypothetical protein
MLLWHCELGEEALRLPNKTQSWQQLLTDARSDDVSGLPEILKTDHEFALIFALAYPHRNNLALTKALDTWFH